MRCDRVARRAAKIGHRRQDLVGLQSHAMPPHSVRAGCYGVDKIATPSTIKVGVADLGGLSAALGIVHKYAHRQPYTIKLHTVFH